MVIGLDYRGGSARNVLRYRADRLLHSQTILTIPIAVSGNLR